MKQKKKIKKQIPQFNENKYLNYVLLLILTVFLVYFTTFKITGDDDVFWHLATGRYIISTGHVPDVDIFGYMTEGQPWMPFEWGWDVITYGIYTISGFIGLSVFRSLIFLIIFALSYYLLRKFDVSFTLTYIGLIILSFGIIDRLTPRPHIISYLFFVLLLVIFLNYRYFYRKNYRQLFFLPIIFLIWANIHMGIIAGLFLFGIYYVSEILTYLYPPRNSASRIKPLTKPEIVRLSLILLASILVIFVNPNFYQTYIYAYEHTQMRMLETVNEWMSPFSSKYSDSLVSYIYKSMLFLGICILYYSSKKKDIFPALLYFGFAIYSVRAMRFTVDYVLIVFIFIFISIDFIIKENLKSDSVRIFINNKPFLRVLSGIFVIFLIFSLSNSKLYLEYLKYYRVSGFGINSDFIPVQMFNFMKENKITDIGNRIFNHFGTGGFFIWNFPDKKNFIDSRNLNDDIFNKYNEILAKRPGFEKKLDEYDIDYAIYLAPDLVRDPAEMERTVISYFCKSAGWKLIFWDDKSFLWVRNNPKFSEIINKYQYKYINPYNYAYTRQIIDNAIVEDKETVIREVDRKKNEEPNGVVINSTLTIFGNRLK